MTEGLDESSANVSVEEPEVVDEIALLTDKLARARADYANLEKRIQRDAVLERERVRARVLEGFLQVYEYARMAEMEAVKVEGAVAQGIGMMVREFERVLNGEGIDIFGAAGDTFDGKIHEAVSAEPGEENMVLRVVAPGFRLGERVLRYAKVVVGT